MLILLIRIAIAFQVHYCEIVQTQGWVNSRRNLFLPDSERSGIWSRSFHFLQEETEKP